MRPIDADSVLAGIEALKQSKWYNDGAALPPPDKRIAMFKARRDAVEMIENACIRQEPTISLADAAEGCRMEERQLLRGLKRIAGLKGCLPVSDIDIINEAWQWIADRAVESTEPVKPCPLTHVLTMEEIRWLPIGTVIWEEFFSGEDQKTMQVIPTMVTGFGGQVVSQEAWDYIADNEPDEFGNMWRYWSARPTQKQREETPWT